MTNQSELQASIRSSTSTVLDYNGDWNALFDAEGINAGTFNERLITYLQNVTGSSSTNINDLKAQYAIDSGVSNWNSVTSVGGFEDGDALLLVDNTSFLLLVDDASKLLLEF